jgi:crotonobetainyl-CoA:carnitine CoA-transferase CaiB-like acyl-CoA transferase
MAGYDFLRGVTVIEAAWLGPDALGGFLADMGATVLKIEEPSHGDLVRHTGTCAVGHENGPGFMHLRWNRGKKSVALDLRTAKGIQIFKQLAQQADVVIDGMRGGTLARMGLGYDVLKAQNPKLVFCSLSGLGLTGPYAGQGSNAPSYDLFAGLTTPPPGAPISKYQGPQPAHTGMVAMGLYAAVGVLAAIVRAQRTGAGGVIEVAAADTAAHWLPDVLEPILNKETSFQRPGWLDKGGRMAKWSRLDNYAARDGKLFYIQLYYEKFWLRFVDAVGRPDLQTLYDELPAEDVDEALAAALTALFRTRTYEEWISLFSREQIPFMPVNTFEDLTRDPHFLARDNLYTVQDPNGVPLKLTSTPIKTPLQQFLPDLAPELGEDTEDVLREVLRLSSEEIKALQSEGVIAQMLSVARGTNLKRQ